MIRWLGVAIALTALAFALSAYIYFFKYDDLPARVPIHWDMAGQANGWVAKENIFGVLFLLPTAMAGLTLLAFVLPWLSPRSFDVDRFGATYGYVMALVVAVFGYLHVIILWASLTKPVHFDLGKWIIGGIFIFLALIGNVLGRVRRNFWMGVRTPWTLASERVWIETHRLSAWIFVTSGLAGLAALLAGVPLPWIFTTFILVIVVVPIGYSLFLYKRLERQGKL
jgi:uncharacterized membrane protein